MAEVNFLVKKGLTVPKGSAATPSIIFDAADGNTGIYSPGADQLALSTNGTGRLFVDASGKVGLNAASTGAYFRALGATGTSIIEAYGADSDGNADVEIKSNGTAGSSRLLFSDTAAQSGIIRYSHSSNSLEFSTAGSEKLRITSAGLVGIGTSSPSAELDVNGDVKVAAGTDSKIYCIGAASNANHLSVGSFNTAGASYFISQIAFGSDGAFGNNGVIKFYTAPGSSSTTERMRIDSSGRVGIGTTSPSSSALLDVTSTTAGFLPPRMTTAQRDAISSPAAGLMVYNTSTNKLNFYNGTAWEAVTSA